MPIPKPFFPSYNRTPKQHGYLNTLHQTLGTSSTCGGALGGWRVGDQAYQAHLSSSFVCYDLHNGLLEADQRSTLCQRKEVGSAIQGTILALSEPDTDPVNATA
ncbi:hypothetical protein Taro_048258 [Colocasia esculenta]|uniref:Uncharacterized protein n=1 Tax=Colocasia esculenta TaxID=4460 RepID=A0A843WVB2_COLES|nr:hypothetical protein [Colocasia esculenta]